jgi:hypothetical protein
MLKDCTEARKANFSLSDVVDVSFDIDKRTVLNNEIVSILQHCGDDGQERADMYEYKYLNRTDQCSIRYSHTSSAYILLCPRSNARRGLDPVSTNFH